MGSLNEIAPEVIQMSHENIRRKLKMILLVVLSFAAMC